MNNKYLIQLATSPIAPNDLEVNDWKLDDFFFNQNPWGLGRIEDVDRKEALDELKGLLPNGYDLDPVNGTIDLPDDDRYLVETVDRLRNITLVEARKYKMPYVWWKREISLFFDILVYFENGELFTLHEFLLFALDQYALDEGIHKVYIGTVYWYDY